MGKISIAELSEILVDKHNLQNQDSELFVASFFEIIQNKEKDLNVIA
jgi:nucleoid DNA-binding protein